jgi:hypothetical protein
MVRPPTSSEQGDGHWASSWAVGVRVVGPRQLLPDRVDHTTRSSTVRPGADQDLRSLTWANMEDEAERFAAALASDSILPEDF